MVICLDLGANDLRLVQLMSLLMICASVKCKMVYLSDAGLPRLSWEKGH